MKKVLKTLTLEELVQSNFRLDFLSGKIVSGATLLTGKEARAAQKEIKALEKRFLTHLVHSVKTEEGIKFLEQTLKDYKGSIIQKETRHFDLAKSYAHLAIDMAALEQTKDVGKASALIDEECRDDTGSLHFGCSSHASAVFQKQAAKILQADGVKITGLNEEQE